MLNSSHGEPREDDHSDCTYPEYSEFRFLQRRCDTPRDRFGRLMDIGFPHAQYAPAEGSQCFVVLPIAIHVPFDLSRPIFRIVTKFEGSKSSGQVSAVPKVAITEDHDFVPWKNYVRNSGQALIVKSISQAEAP